MSLDDNKEYEKLTKINNENVKIKIVRLWLLPEVSKDKIFLKSELFSNDGKKKFQFQNSGHFREAKEIGYEVGRELLKKAGSDFTTQEN